MWSTFFNISDTAGTEFHHPANRSRPRRGEVTQDASKPNGQTISCGSMNQYEKLRSLGQQLRDEQPGDFRILDVGAGDGSTEYSPFFAGLATDYVGVDPDEDIHDNTWLHQRFHQSAETFAAEHAASVAAGDAQPFDMATAIYVWEHLEAPAELLKAAHSVLRPGGTMICITPNGLHPFGLGSKVLAKFDLTDRVLRKLRPDEIDHYHFPVVATRNTIWGVRSCAEEAGFSEVDVMLHDEPNVFVPYLPEKLHALPHAYSKVIAATKLDVLSGTLIITLTK